MTMPAGTPPLTEHKITIAFGDTDPQHMATLHTPADAPPPTRAEYADALRTIARNLTLAPEGTHVMAAAIVLQRT